ncbi:MAG: hypothetical protein WBV69_22200 [Candidatus Sulfotelmatobacter sp.]
MKPRWAIVGITVLALICAGIILRAQLNNRRLAKQAAEYRIRAEQGDAESQFKLGSMYYRGKGIPQNYREAARWYRKSAEQGYAKSEYNLSSMYRDGKGVPRDYAEAERWCRKAAEQGDAWAEEGLGFLYYRGEGVPQNYAEAARWYGKSAEQGDANAEYILGYLYYYGYGVPQDKSEANRLFHQAAAQGNENARRALARNTVRAPATSKIMLLFKFLACLVFGIAFFKSVQNHRTRGKIATGVAVLLLICAIALDLFWHFYVGHLQSSTTVTALYLLKQLIGGAIIGVLAFIVHKKSAKIVLIAAAAIFVGCIAFEVVHFELRHVPVRVWFLCFVGLPIGMAIPSAVFLWLDSKRSGQVLDGKGDAAIAPVTTK